MTVPSQVAVLTSEDGAGLIGKRGGVTTIFVHEHFSGELLGCEDKTNYVVIVSHDMSDAECLLFFKKNTARRPI